MSIQDVRSAYVNMASFVEDWFGAINKPNVVYVQAPHASAHQARDSSGKFSTPDSAYQNARKKVTIEHNLKASNRSRQSKQAPC